MSTVVQNKKQTFYLFDLVYSGSYFKTRSDKYYTEFKKAASS